MREAAESDAELRIMTGCGREKSGILYRVFAAKWAAIEGAAIGRRRKYRQERAGKSGPGPAGDACED